VISRIFGQPHLEKPRPNSGRGKVRESSAETVLRQSYPIRGEAAAAAENKPLVAIVGHDDARHDSAEARPRTSQAEAGRMKS
jgi:hypothetical protein